MRKIIQIIESTNEGDDNHLYALCDDGTVWARCSENVYNKESKRHELRFYWQIIDTKRVEKTELLPPKNKTKL